MIRVERDQEAQSLESFLALRSEDDASVDGLLRGSDLDARLPRRSVVVRTPSRRRRVASLACFVERASENGPTGRSTRS